MHESAISAILLFLANQSPVVLLVLILSPVGFALVMTGTVIVLNSRSERRYAALLETYKADVDKLSKYYENNVKLVESWEKIGEGFQSIVILNTQTMQKVCDQLDTVRQCVMMNLQSGKNGKKEAA